LQGFSGSGYFFAEVSGQVKDVEIVVVGTLMVVVAVLVDIVGAVVGSEGFVDVVGMVVVIVVDSVLVIVVIVDFVVTVVKYYD
jgi:hypothetical protein